MKAPSRPAIWPGLAWLGIPKRCQAALKEGEAVGLDESELAAFKAWVRGRGVRDGLPVFTSLEAFTFDLLARACILHPKNEVIVSKLDLNLRGTYAFEALLLPWERLCESGTGDLQSAADPRR